MPELTLTVNGRPYQLDVPEDMPLLWALRDRLGLAGTKFGCGVGICGACVVHIDGKPSRSCMVRTGALAGRKIVTIEGLTADTGHSVQEAWLDLQVPQCGYCQSGQIMTAAALLADAPSPSDAEIDTAMSRVLCRCGTYQRIRKAVHRASELLAAREAEQ